MDRGRQGVVKRDQLTMFRYPNSMARRALAFAIVPTMGIPACNRAARVAHDDSWTVAPMRSTQPEPIISENAYASQKDSQPVGTFGTALRIVPDWPEATDDEVRYAWASIEWHGRNEMFWLPLNGAETTVQLQRTVPTSELLTIRFSIPDKQSEVGRFVQGEWAIRNLSSNNNGGGQFEVCVPMASFRRIDVSAIRLRPSS